MHNSLAKLYQDYQSAIDEATWEYRQDGTWHVDMCNCERCQVLERWYDLPWYLGLWARLVRRGNDSKRIN